MRLNESNPELRRILLTINTADGTGLATDVDGMSPTLLVARGDDNLVAASGALVHVSNEDRLHYYEASSTEATTPGFLLVIVMSAGIQVAFGWAPIGQIFALGETNPAKLRLPVTIFDTNEPSLPGTGAIISSPSQLRSSVNGRAFANDGGSLVEIGFGAYYWQATPAAASDLGFTTVEVEPTGFAVCMSWVSVDNPDSTVIPPPPAPPPIPPAPSSGGSGLSFLPGGSTLGAIGATLPNITGGLDRFIDPATGDYVRTANGEWAETQDSRTIMLIALSIELGASPYDPNHGTGIAAQRRAGGPLSSDYLQAETVRVGQDLANEGVLSDLLVQATDPTGRQLRDSAGRVAVRTQWRDLASGSPIDSTFTIPSR
jgi:hypothetical protein